MKTFSLILMVAVLIAVLQSHAQIPRTLSYQGVLTDTLGNPRSDGLYNFTFRLYPVNSGGTALWTETKSLQVRRGLFSTAIGDVTPLGLAFNAPYWLSIQVAGEPEMIPRIPLSSVGYSFSAIKSDTAAYALSAPVQGFVDSARIAGTIPNNSVSTAKIQDGAVTSAKILDGTIQRTDVQTTFKAPFADTSDFARVATLSGSAGGDLTGTYPNPTITTNAVSTAKIADNAVTSAKILDGTIQRVDVASNFKAPYADTADAARSATMNLPWAGVASGAGGELGAFAVRNFATANYENGLFGLTWSDLGNGVYGIANSPTGLSNGVYGKSISPTGIGVWGDASAATGYTAGVLGGSSSTTGVGVSGSAIASSGATQGVSGYSYSPDGVGVYGQHVSASGIAPGLQGVTNSISADAVGILGVVSSASPGSSSAAVRGINNGTGPSGIGVWGSQNGTGYGVYGRSAGIGVVGTTFSPTGSSIGVYGGTTLGTGVVGEFTHPTAYGTGVLGRSYSGYGHGVLGITQGNQTYFYAGVFGESIDTLGFGVIGKGPYFGGTNYWRNAVWAYGDLIASGSKYFQIDHPLDPANKFLNHACTEGPEPLNVYSGNITLDVNGEAWVNLPSYFQEINKDFRYQLTPIGNPSTLYIADEIHNNRFRIAGGRPGMKVSWRVEAVRNDLYVRHHMRPVEQDKPAQMQGKYLEPDLYGQPKESGIFYSVERERSLPQHTPVVLPVDTKETVPLPKDVLLERIGRSNPENNKKR